MGKCSKKPCILQNSYYNPKQTFKIKTIWLEYFHDTEAKKIVTPFHAVTMNGA